MHPPVDLHEALARHAQALPAAWEVDVPLHNEKVAPVIGPHSTAVVNNEHNRLTALQALQDNDSTRR
jgi:hypothetical protein